MKKLVFFTVVALSLACASTTYAQCSNCRSYSYQSVAFRPFGGFFQNLFGGGCAYQAYNTPARPCAPVESCAPCAPCSTCEGGVCEIPAPCPEPPKELDEIQPCEPVQNAPSCSGDSCPITTTQAVENVYLANVNAVRARYGRRALVIDSALDNGCAAQCQNMAIAGYIFHARGCGYEICASNSGQGVPGALNQWLWSPAHAALLLNPNFTRCGVQCRTDRYGRSYCAMRFR